MSDIFERSLQAIKDFDESEEGISFNKKWFEDLAKDEQDKLDYYETHEFFKDLDNMESGELLDWKAANSIFATYPEYVYEDKECPFSNECIDYDYGHKTFKFKIIHGQGSVLFLELNDE